MYSTLRSGTLNLALANRRDLIFGWKNKRNLEGCIRSKKEYMYLTYMYFV